MRAEPYVERLKRHLAAYKRDVLGVAEDGIWSRNGRAYPHILPAAQRDLNLLAPLRAEMRAFLAATPTFRYHMDFHHLNSSQAMCLNLLVLQREFRLRLAFAPRPPATPALTPQSG